ncbi:hypothetical protein [Alloacidobacterium dinghuense]|uniref:hypothetical protein n=1 Tax=Alloacidobacterium dinghuense TaxID=2763107 RepID=UPI002036B2E9|nr:hypothetical protein [Alloacidobacterium dinghuense]
MRRNTCTNLLLLIIAIALVAIAVRPYIAPHPVNAQSSSAYPFYFEPGTQMLRAPDGTKQLYGRVVVDMRNGKVWGFPTNTPDTYPVNQMDTKPQVSRPSISEDSHLKRPTAKTFAEECWNHRSPACPFNSSVPPMTSSRH